MSDSDDLEARLARRKTMRERRSKTDDISGETPTTPEAPAEDSPTSARDRIRSRRRHITDDNNSGSGSDVATSPSSSEKRLSRFRRNQEAVQDEVRAEPEPSVPTPEPTKEPVKEPEPEPPKQEPVKGVEPPLTIVTEPEQEQEEIKEEKKEPKRERKSPIKPSAEAPKSPKHEYTLDEGDNAGQRLYNKGKEFVSIHEQKMEGQRKKKEEDELQGATFRPTISKKAQGILKKDNYYDYNKEWKTRVEEELQRKRDQKQKEEDDEQNIVKKPEMNSKSKSIMDKKQREKRYVGPISGWEKRFDDYQAHQRPAHEEPTFSPQINLHSKKIVESKPTSENTFERLYNLSTSKKSEEPTEEEKKSPYRKSEHEMSNFVRYLQSKGEEIEKKKNEYRNMIAKEEVRAPKFNQTSMRLARQQYRKPLYSPRRSTSSASSHESSKKTSPQATSPKGFEFMQRRAAQEKVKQERLEFIKKLQDEQELKECTFRPELNRKSMTLALNFLADDNDDFDDFDEFEDEDEDSFIENEIAMLRSRSSQSSPKSPVHALSKSKQNSVPAFKKQTSNTSGFASPNSKSSPLTKKALSQNNLLSRQPRAPARQQEYSFDQEEEEEVVDDNYLSGLEQEMKAALDDWSRLEQMQL
jgi:hypothetical protein